MTPLSTFKLPDGWQPHSGFGGCTGAQWQDAGGLELSFSNNEPMFLNKSPAETKSFPISALISDCCVFPHPHCARNALISCCQAAFGLIPRLPFNVIAVSSI